MKKRIISLLLTACMLVSLVSGPAYAQGTASGEGQGTADETVTHNWANKYSGDATHHWYACTDEGCTEINDKKPHTFWENGICACFASKIGGIQVQYDTNKPALGDNNTMTQVESGVWQIVYTDVQPADYLIQFSSTGSDFPYTWATGWVNLGNGDIKEIANSSGYDFLYITDQQAGSTVTLTLDLTGFDYCAKTGATCLVEVEAPAPHEHAWAETYASSFTHHWHNCTAEGCKVLVNADKDGYAPHNFAGGVCICGAREITEVVAVGNGAAGSPWMNGIGWDPAADANLMKQVRPGVFEITFRSVPGKTYEAAACELGGWSAGYNWRTGVIVGSPLVSGVPVPAGQGEGNFTIELIREVADITLTLDLTAFDYATQTGATFTFTEKAPHEHKWLTNQVWAGDGIGHWYECTEDCPITDNTEKEGYEFHTAPADDGDCLTAVTCPTCGYVFQAAMPQHTYLDDGDISCENLGCTHTRPALEESHAHGEVAFDTPWSGFMQGQTLSQSASIVLTDDVTVDGVLTVAQGATVNLCLNGCTLRADQIVNDGTLNIYDCRDSNGRIIGLKTELLDTSAAILNNGELNLFGGTVSGNSLYAIFANEGFVGVCGGTVTNGDTAIGLSYAELEITGGIVSGGSTGIFNLCGTVKISSGSVIGRKGVTNSVFYGTAGRLFVSGGSVTGSAYAIDNGGECYLSGKPTIQTVGSGADILLYISNVGGDTVIPETYGKDPDSGLPYTGNPLGIELATDLAQLGRTVVYGGTGEKFSLVAMPGYGLCQSGEDLLLGHPHQALTFGTAWEGQMGETTLADANIVLSGDVTFTGDLNIPE